MPDATNTIQIIISAQDKASQTIKQTGKSMDGLTGIAGALKTGLIALGIAGAARTAMQFEELGAESIRAKTSLGFLMGSAEEAERALKDLQEATGGEVTQAQLAAQATELLVSGLVSSREEMVRVIGAAEGLGDVMGISATQAIDSFSRALLYRTPRALRQLGIDADNVKKRMVELMAAESDLTEEQAFTEAALQEVEKTLSKIGAADGAAYDAVDAIDRLKVAITELKTVAGESLVPVFSDVADALVEWIKFTPQQKNRLTELAQETLRTSTSFEEYSEVLADAADAEGLMIDGAGDLRERLGVEVVAANYKLTRSMYDLARGMERSAEMADALGQGLDRVYPEMTDTRDAASQLLDQLDPLSEEAGRLSRSFGEMDASARRVHEGLLLAAQGAGELGSSFADFDISKEASWNLLLETIDRTKVSAKELGVMAVEMGVATASEVQQTLKMYELAEAMNAGTLSTREFSIAMQEIRTGTFETNTAMESASTGMLTASDRYRARFGDIRTSVEDVATSVSELDGQEAEVAITIPDADPLMEWMTTFNRLIKDAEGKHTIRFDVQGGGGIPTAPSVPSSMTTPAGPGVGTSRGASAVTTTERSGPGAGNPQMTGGGNTNFNLTVNTSRELFSVRHEFEVMEALGGQ